MSDLDDALADLRRGMERFAEAYVTSVARMLDRELDALTRSYAAPGQFPRPTLDTKTVMACPNTAEHPRHVWSFPKSTLSRQCPGVPTPRVPAFPPARCLKSDAHPAHDYEAVLPEGTGVQGRHCPGLTGVQCPDNLAHHVHAWSPTPGISTLSCPGLEADREARWCGPDDRVSMTHQPHEWFGVSGGEDALLFCKGTPPVMASGPKNCPNGRVHTAHYWQDSEDKAQSCPGRKVFGGIPTA